MVENDSTQLKVFDMLMLNCIQITIKQCFMVLTVLVLTYRQLIVFYHNLNNQPPAPKVIPAPHRPPQRHNPPISIAPQLLNPPSPQPTTALSQCLTCLPQFFIQKHDMENFEHLGKQELSLWTPAICRTCGTTNFVIASEVSSIIRLGTI